MTFRQSLQRYVRGLLSEELPQPMPSDPPPPSPGLTPPITTPSSMMTSGISEAGLVQVVMQTMREMQTENLREIRGMVTDILQGRPLSETELAARLASQPEEQPLRDSFDPPDYDSPDISDLPDGIQSVFERERIEQADLRNLRTEREVLAAQLDEARAMLMDPQGPASELSL